MKADRAAITRANVDWPAATRLILLYGPDTAASADLADGLARQFVSAADPLAMTRVAGATLDKDPGALLGAASAVSMFGDRSLVRVDDAGDDAAAAVKALLDGPDGNPVVMTAGALKKTSRLVVLVEGAATALAFISYPPDARAALAMVTEIGLDVGLRPSNAAARALLAATAADRGILRRELEKLALYLDAVPERIVPLELDAVTALAADLGDADLGGMVDAVAGGHPVDADRQLAQLRDHGVAGIQQLRAVVRRFWMLLDLRLAVDGGVSASSAVDAARPPVFWKDKAMVAAQVADWRTPALRNMLARCLATERAIKHSGTAGDVLATQFLLGIAARRAR